MIGNCNSPVKETVIKKLRFRYNGMLMVSNCVHFYADRRTNEGAYGPDGGRQANGT